jgi:uncharacterized protein (TIGR02271 family)
MQGTFGIDQLDAMRGSPVYDSAGEKIGSIEEIFVDEQTRQPEWIGIGTGFFGTKRVLVPVTGAEQSDNGLRVPYEKDQVKDSPDIDSDEISQETESQLTQYYGVGYSEQQSDTGLPHGTAGGADLDRNVEGPDTPGDVQTGERDGYVTRSEEELHVGKEQVRSGQARLRKWVETEPVEMDVELKRETARVTREPVNQPVSGAEIGEEQVDVELREERPVVAKQAVAKERVGLETDVETETETVSDDVRKERVEVEGDNDALTR